MPARLGAVCAVFTALVVMWLGLLRTQRNPATPLMVAGWTPSNFSKGITAGPPDTSVAPPLERRAVYLSAIPGQWTVMVIVTDANERRSCRNYMGWATSAPVDQPEVRIGREQIPIVLTEMISNRVGTRIVPSRTCYSGTVSVRDRFLNVVSFAPFGEVANVLGTLTIDLEGVVHLGELPAGWSRFDSRQSNTAYLRPQTVRYPGEKPGEQPGEQPGDVAQVISVETLPTIPDSTRLTTKEQRINGRRVWQDGAPKGGTLVNRRAIVLYNGLACVVSATVSQQDFLRLVGNIRIATAKDRNQLLKSSVFAIGDLAIEGVLQAEGELATPENAPKQRWRVVSQRRDDVSRTNHFVGLVGVSGAITDDGFPGTRTIRWIRSDPQMTIVAVPSAERPTNVVATSNHRKFAATFVPANGLTYQYAFLSGVELRESDTISVSVRGETTKRTNKDFAWEAPERHL